MKIIDVSIDETHVYVVLNNGIVIGHPLKWYPRLAKATYAERKGWRINKWSDAIRWEGLDEDLSLEGFLSIEEHMLPAREK